MSFALPKKPITLANRNVYNYGMSKNALKSNEILFEDNHLLVINKRAGLVTQGAAAGQPSLIELAKDYIRKKYNKPGNVYLGIVSRLDAKTSGVIVIARTSKAAARLNDQFRERSTKKRYWAIVAGKRGEAIADVGQMEDWMIKDEPAMMMRCLANPRKGAQKAKLSWQVIGRSENRRVLEVVLQTGRKHQIRCQFASQGFPILGDKKYGSSLGFPGPGIALHSQSLEFQHPTKKTELQFEAPIPEYWTIAGYNL